MSWFGGSSSSKSGDDDFSSDSMSGSGDMYSSPSMSSYDDGMSGGSSGLGGSSNGFSGGSGNEEALRMALQQEQQKAVVQAAINKLTELCWDKCISRPDVKLSSGEQECISYCAERYLDTSMAVMNRMATQTPSQGR